MKAYKEELDRLRTMLESMHESSRSCTISIKGKISFNLVGHKSQGVCIINLDRTNYMNESSFLIHVDPGI